MSFTVESTAELTSAKDALLRAARRQLHYTGLLEPDHQPLAGGDEVRALPTAHRLLSDMVLFESLDQVQVASLANQLRAVRLEPGETLFTQGDLGVALYVISSGVLEISRQVDSVSEIIGCIGAGEYLGEISLLTGDPHATNAIARTHCQAYQLSREAIEPLLSESAVGRLRPRIIAIQRCRAWPCGAGRFCGACPLGAWEPGPRRVGRVHRLGCA
jgi:Cyclic nucleotide-binding domain